MKKNLSRLCVFCCIFFFSCSNSIEKETCKTVENFFQAVYKNDFETVKQIAPFISNYSAEEQNILLQFFYEMSKQKREISINSINDGIIFVNLDLYDKSENKYLNQFRQSYILECVLDENSNLILTENFRQKTLIQDFDAQEN